MDSRLELLSRLQQSGVCARVVLPDGQGHALGGSPARVVVRFHSQASLDALVSGDHLRLARSYLAGEIDIDGSMLEIMPITALLDLDPGIWTRVLFQLRLRLRNRRRFQRESIQFHYDRPPEFFLPWLDRWRSYSHGFYEHPDDTVTAAQARKLQYAIDVLQLKPGMHVFDMGGGWGSFIEFAGRQGIHVTSVTISKEQYCYVTELIQREDLPCQVELVDFLDYRPQQMFDAAVFMGTFEHFTDYGFAAQFLSQHLKEGGGLYADFCAQQRDFLAGEFLTRYIWPGTATYVNLPRLLESLLHQGLRIREVRDDTLSYARTVHDWAHVFDQEEKTLTENFGRESTRAFRLFLWASAYFLYQGRTQAYHLVAQR